MSHLLIPFFCCEVQDLFFAGWRWGCCQQKDPWLLLSVDISLQLSLQSYWLWREKLDWTQRRKSKEASAQNSRCVNYFLHCWKLFLCVCVCVASALRGLHQLQWIYKRFSFSSGKCLHMLWFPCLPRIVQSQSDERWPRSYWSRTHPQQLQNKGNIFPSPPRLNPSRTMFLFPFWVYENWTCCFFSSHPPLIFSSILLFRSLLLTNKLKQHAFVHLTGKLLALACCVLVYLFPPSSLNYLNTPGSCLHCSPRDGGLIRIDLSQQLIFFFYTFLQKVWLPGFQITFYPYLLIILCSLQFYLGKYARTARHSRPCQL